MATFKQYTKKDGSTLWQYQTYLGVDEVTGKDIRTTRRGFSTKKQAQIDCNKILTDFAENGRNKIEVHTFKQLYDVWIDAYKLTVKQSTYIAVINNFKIHILPEFGNIRLDKLTTTYCQKVINAWHKNTKICAYLKTRTNQVLRYALSKELIKSNPMANIIMPRAKERERNTKFYNKEQLSDFLVTVKDYNIKYYTFFHLLAYTGIRKGEALALQWQDIDTINNTLSVNKTISTDLGGGACIQTPKTSYSKRIIQLDNKTLNILKEWRKYQRILYLKLGFNTGSDTQYLFTTFKNELTVLSSPNVWLSRILHKCNLSHITVHSFRHTHCSLLFEAGATIKETQERLGHTDIKTTMNIYTHVTKKTIKDTGSKFAKYMEL
jgi:Site-specific recombinase XerD